MILLAAVMAAQPADPVSDWNDVALRHQEAGRYRDAGEAYRKAIAAAESTAAAPAVRLRVHLNLVSLLLEEGSHRSAAQWLRAAEAWTHELPSNGPDLAAFHNAVATLRLMEGKLSEALHAYEKVLRIVDRPTVQYDDVLACALQNIASVQMRQGHFDPARRNLERAIAMLESVSGTHQSHMIRAFASLSTLEYLAKDYAAAEKAAARALTMAENHYGADSPIAGDILENYALILDRLRRGKEAKLFRSRARTIQPGAVSGFRPLIDLTELKRSKGAAVRTK